MKGKKIKQDDSDYKIVIIDPLEDFLKNSTCDPEKSRQGDFEVNQAIKKAHNESFSMVDKDRFKRLPCIVIMFRASSRCKVPPRGGTRQKSIW